MILKKQGIKIIRDKNVVLKRMNNCNGELEKLIYMK